MATRAQIRGLNGVDSLRKKLRNMEKVAESGIKPAITEILQSITMDAKQLAPKDEGELAASIEYKLSSDGLAGVSGPAAKSAAVATAVKGSPFATRSTKVATDLSKKKLFNFFKGYWAEFGTKGNPARNIPPQPARPFMRPAFDLNSSWGIKKIADAVNAQLKKMSGEK